MAQLFSPSSSKRRLRLKHAVAVSLRASRRNSAAWMGDLLTVSIRALDPDQKSVSGSSLHSAETFIFALSTTQWHAP